MAGKKPWCADDACDPRRDTRFHQKGCARRDAFLKGKEKDTCRSADGYHIPGCPSASAKRLREESAPVVVKKSWWKRVFGGLGR